jgi:hypothetical protein
MRTQWKLLPFMAAALLAGGVATSCSDDDTFERAGEEVDEALDDAEDAVEDAADETGEAIEEAGDKIEDKTDDDPNTEGKS